MKTIKKSSPLYISIFFLTVASFFFVSLYVSFITGSISKAEAAACRAIVTVDGQEVGDKNASKTIYSTDDPVDIQFEWRTDGVGERSATIIMPRNAKIDGPRLDGVAWNGPNGRAYIWSPTNEKRYGLPAERGGNRRTGTLGLYDWRDGDTVELKTSAKNLFGQADRCSVRVTVKEVSSSVGIINVSGSSNLDIGDRSTFSANTIWTNTRAYYRMVLTNRIYIDDIYDDTGWSPIPNSSSGSAGFSNVSGTLDFDVPSGGTYYVVVQVRPSGTSNVSGQLFKSVSVDSSPSSVQVDISGPENVSVNDTNSWRSDFDLSNTNEGEYRYYWYDISDGGGVLSGDLISDSGWRDIPSSHFMVLNKNFGNNPGDYRYCVSAVPTVNGARYENGRDTSCINVTVVDGDRPEPGYDADFISQSAPAQVEPGERFSVSITMRNTGDDWIPSSDFELGSQNPTNNNIWGTKRVNLPKSVDRGESVTFNFTAQAPNNEGTYDFQWRMIGDDPSWFGDRTDNVRISVRESNPSEATLNIRSSNPSSGVSIDERSGNLGSGRTSYEVTRTSNLSGTLRAPSRADGNDFDRWDGCNSTSGRDCTVSVSTGSSKTVTAIYEGGTPPITPPPGGGNKAVLNVSSQGVNNVPINHLREDILGPDGRTNYTREYDDAIPEGTWWLTAPASRGGMSVSGWNGCDRTGDGGRTCAITSGIDKGETRNLTVIYSPGPPPPPSDKAVLSVSSEGLSNVPINHVHEHKLGEGDRTNYTREYDEEITETWITAPGTRSGYALTDWDGCNRTANNGTACYIDSIEIGEVREITVTYEEDVDNDPRANAGQDHWVLINRSYSHSGAFATDEDGDLQSYNWSWESCTDYDGSSFSCPSLSNASGSLNGGDANISGPGYTPTQAGHYITRLTVTDSNGNQDTSTVTGTTPQCSDGVDHDGDGLIDFGESETNDPDCEDPYDNQEAASPFNFNVFRIFER